MSRIVQYRRIGGPEVLEEAEVPDPEPGDGEVRVAVHAVGLNPIDFKTFGGDLRVVENIQRLIHPVRNGRTPRFPRGVAHDFAGIVEAVGAGGARTASSGGLHVGDAVLGTLRSAPGQVSPRGALATELIAPVGDLTVKPKDMSFEVAASLGVAAQTTCGAFRRLDLQAQDVVVISAAAGGVGSLAVQVAVSRGATVIGIASERNADYLRRLGAIPVAYGDGLLDRLRKAAPSPVTKLFDCYGGDYTGLGFALGLSGHSIGTLVPSPRALLRGAQFTGARHAQPGDLDAVAHLVADGVITVETAGLYPFTLEAVRTAYEELAGGHVRGKLVVSVR
ncbi:NADP-dependent oxidoreductase [Actinomyces viscosus]|uniref:Quinone oxidoreductase 1 n=1 Tax=Actinomyces viscosus TaxID=1656 RepID=A0A448PKL8_ACTVI|nr:NADP-dependent oxidoreductase [Actinomyces viscosus]TFH51275.1 NADP-dependent oxidoreductase [Actinomyces viscosus]VEI15862.1 Quinone oxidoreductase 1 [Actinomyces viscosus]